MPYFISDKQSDCQGWATVKEEDDGSYTTIGCHGTKQDAIDQMVAVSISEDMEPGGEVRAVDLTAPQFIRDNAARGLRYLEEGFGGDGLTDATKREAREMAEGRITENKVRKMAPWFSRHKVDGEAPKNRDESHPEFPGAGLVAWLLWGGDSNFSDRAQNWAQRKIDALDAEADSRSKMKKVERRTFTVKNIEAREVEDGKMRLSGYAAVFNSASVPLPFKEVIAPGAFRKTLSETPDVRLLVNHEGLPLARTKNGTLTLSEDEIGLRFDAEIADTQEGRDIYTLVERGDVDQMSFAFRVIRQKWNNDRTERMLTEVSLADGDVSVVTYPAYTATTVEAREHIKKALEAIKEGREVTGESLIVLQSIFEDMSEGHEYIMKALRLFETLMVEDNEKEDYEEEEDSRAVDVVGDFVEWDSSGGVARGRIEHVMTEGVLGIPDSDFSINAEEGNPAILIRVYREVRDGWEPTEVLVGHKASELRAIDPLPSPSEEQSRKISLRLAKAIIEANK
jgi:HK97 family phage prohead protease